MCDPVLKVTMILDESGSIVGNGPGSANISNVVRDGALTFLSQLDGGTMQVRIIEFNSQARLSVPYTLVTSAGIAEGGVFHRYLYGDGDHLPSNNHYDPEDYKNRLIFTNWEGAMQKANDGGSTDLVVFFSDGNPTARCLSGSCDDFETRTPICDALAEGETAAEAIKAAGTRIVAIGYPNQVLVDCNVSAVSGSNKYNTGENILTQADYIEVTSNSQLISTFGMIGESLMVPCVVSSEGTTEETTICASASLTLDVNAGEANTNWTYKWNDPAGSTSKSVQVSPTEATTYHVTVTDRTSGCSQVCSFRVLTEYCCEPPVLACPTPTLTVACSTSPSEQATKTTPNGLPECNGYTINYSETSHPGPCGGSYTRTWRLQLHGQTVEQCSQTVTVSAANKPTATAPANTIMECSDGTPSPTELFFTNGLSGDCQVSGMIMGVISGTHDACGGSYAETWTFDASNNCGGEPIVITRIIGVAPGSAPSLNCDVGSDLVLECGSDDQDEVIAEWLLGNESAIMATATSPCGVDGTITNNFQPSMINSLRCDQDRGAVVFFTVTDACGRKVSCTKKITLEDTTEPVWDRVAENDTAACGTPLSEIPWPVIGATDACAGERIVTHSAAEGERNCGGASMIRTYTAVDLCGNRAEMSYTIYFTDDVPPVITPPANTTISCSSPIPGDAPIVTDVCSASIEVTVSESRVNVSFCEYDLIRTWTATDDCGNVSSASQTISFRDLLPPEITLTPDFAALLDEDGNMHIYGCDMPEMLDANAIVTDDCCFIPARLQSFDIIKAQNICDVFGYHTHYRCGYEYTDVGGHTARFEFDVFQYDTIAPVIYNMPEDLEISCNQSIVPTASDVIFASDNCDPDIDVLFSENTVIEQAGSSRTAQVLRTWTFIDDCGNSTSATQTIKLCDIPGSTRGPRLTDEQVNLDERTHITEEDNYPTVGDLSKKKFKRTFQADVVPFSGVGVSPNPTSDWITLRFESEKDVPVAVEVLDAVGQSVHTIQMTAGAGANATRMDLSAQPEGVYFVRIISENKQVIIKLVKY